MVIALNLTVLVQVVHFWCAYLICKKLFLQEAIAELEARHEHERRVRAQIRAFELQAEEKEHEVRRLEHVFGSDLAPKKPSLHTVYPVENLVQATESVHDAITVRQLDELIREASESIVEGALHD